MSIEKSITTEKKKLNKLLTGVYDNDSLWEDPMIEAELENAICAKLNRLDEINARYCPKCNGRTLDKNAYFCNKCGTKYNITTNPPKAKPTDFQCDISSRLMGCSNCGKFADRFADLYCSRCGTKNKQYTGF